MTLAPSQPDLLSENRTACPDDIPAYGPHHRLDRLRAHALLLAAMLLTGIAAVLSSGVYHEDDLTHFLIARWVRHDWRYLVEAWGRPGFTALYALPAMVGDTQWAHMVCRLLSVGLSGATAWFAWRVGRQLGLRQAWLVIPLIFLQPLFTRLSLTTLTETPLACYLAILTYLLYRNKLTAATLVMGLTPLARDEAVVLWPLWLMVLWRQGGCWWQIPLLGWAVAVQNLAAWGSGIEVPLSRWLQPAGADQYGQGSLLSFVPKLMLSAGPVVVGLAILGAGSVWRRGGWFMVTGTLVWFLAETVIYWRGAFSSGGYARFLVPMAPWLAVMAAAGAGTIWQNRDKLLRQIQLRRLLMLGVGFWVICEIAWRFDPPVVPQALQRLEVIGRWCLFGLAGMAAVLAWRLNRQGFTDEHDAIRSGTIRCGAIRYGFAFLGVIAGSGLLYGLFPLPLNEHQRAVRSAAAALEEAGLSNQSVLTMHRWYYYWTDRWMPPMSRDPLQWLAAVEPGTLFLWDGRFCTESYPAIEPEELASDGWLRVWPVQPDEMGDRPFLIAFQRVYRSPSIQKVENPIHFPHF